MLKRILVAIGLGILPWTAALASPYFRLLDPSHPQPVIGALVDPYHTSQTEAATLLPLVTHDPKDGCILPALVCESWSPAAVGAAVNAGKFTFDYTPVFNVMPWMGNIIEAAFPGTYTREVSPVTISAGPVWEYQELTNKGYFKVFTGLSLNF